MMISLSKLYTSSSFIYLKIRIVYFFATLVVLVSCNNSDENGKTPLQLKASEVIQKLGGETFLTNARTISYSVQAATFEHEQDGPEVEKPINGNNHTYDFYSVLNDRKVRLDYKEIIFNYPFTYQCNGARLTINDKEGSISGQYNWSSYYLGWSSPTAVYSSRIEAVLKNQKMANPIALLQDWLDRNTLTTNSKEEAILIPTGAQGLNIELVIDQTTGLPEKARVMESDFIFGDVWFEVIYDDWTSVSETQFPTLLTYKLDNKIIKQETLSNIKFNSELDESLFTLEEVDKRLAYDPQQGAYGIYSSQWYHRLFAGGIPADQPLNNGSLILENFDLTPFGMSDQTIGENMKLVGRPDASNWATTIKTSEGIIVVEAPLNPRWTRSLINTIKNQYPNDPIAGVVVTHTHYDHFGGIREMLSETDKVYIGQGSELILRRSIQANKTLLPDALSFNPRSININTVDGITKIGDGEVEVHLLKLEDENHNAFSKPNSHSDEMVIVYVPEYEAIIQADFLYEGIFINIFKGNMANSFTGPAREELRRRANFILDYIAEKNLKVTRIIGVHGGVGTLEDLSAVAE